jgi:hypothetical protein
MRCEDALKAAIRKLFLENLARCHGGYNQTVSLSPNSATGTIKEGRFMPVASTLEIGPRRRCILFPDRRARETAG